MRKAPAFQFYPRDFLVGSALFSNEEKGIYITLLCYQWEHGRVPSSLKMISRLASCKTSRLSAVLAKFSKDENGDYYNERLEDVRIKQEEHSQKQSRNGALGGRPKHKPKESQGLAKPNSNCKPEKALQSESESDTAVKDKEDSAAAPLPFDSHGFAEAWTDWLAHLRAKRKSPTPQACKGQLGKLEAMGEQRAMAALRHSIAGNYQGIFEDSSKAPHQPKKAKVAI